MSLLDKFPEIKLPNKFYKNDGELIFQDMKDSIGNDRPTYSNGAVYADLDNDGDLDVVVNNIDDPVLVYENKDNPQRFNIASTSEDERFLFLSISDRGKGLNGTVGQQIHRGWHVSLPWSAWSVG